jgi:hypothetical protein
LLHSFSSNVTQLMNSRYGADFINLVEEYDT